MLWECCYCLISWQLFLNSDIESNIKHDVDDDYDEDDNNNKFN